MPTDIPASNAPQPGSGYPVNPWFCKRLTLANDERQIHHIDSPGIWRPLSLIFSSTSTVTLEVSCSDPRSNMGKAGFPTPKWVAVTLTNAFTQIQAPVTAIRVTNGSGSEITVDVL